MRWFSNCYLPTFNKPTAILTRAQFISETNDCNLISGWKWSEEISRIRDRPWWKRSVVDGCALRYSPHPWYYCFINGVVMWHSRARVRDNVSYLFYSAYSFFVRRFSLINTFTEKRLHLLDILHCFYRIIKWIYLSWSFCLRWELYISVCFNKIDYENN